MNSKDPHFCRAARALSWMVFIGLALAAGQAYADAETNVVTVQAEIVTNQFEAYAQAEPIALLPVRLTEAGVVGGLSVAPGAAVRAGQKLAELKGAQIRSLIAQDEAAAAGAGTNLMAAQKSLVIQREQLPSHLVTQQTVLQAEAALAQARAAMATARAQLKALRQAMVLRAPCDGTVLAVNAVNGDNVAAGDTILTLQPANQLWLKASYYGADAAAIHAGMTGEFFPADSGGPVSVKVATVFGALTPDGGEAVGMVAATGGTNWVNGEFGTVTLNGASRPLPAVPTRALILDQGQWWVLVRTEKGEQKRLVVPGPVRGWQTFIESGLKPGDQVVAGNACLEFHRDISQTYESDD